MKKALFYFALTVGIILMLLFWIAVAGYIIDYVTVPVTTS